MTKGAWWRNTSKKKHRDKRQGKDAQKLGEENRWKIGGYTG